MCTSLYIFQHSSHFHKMHAQQQDTTSFAIHNTHQYQSQPYLFGKQFQITYLYIMNMSLKSSDFVNTNRKGNNVLIVEFRMHFKRALYKFYMNSVLSHFFGINAPTTNFYMYITSRVKCSQCNVR